MTIYKSAVVSELALQADSTRDNPEPMFSFD